MLAPEFDQNNVEKATNMLKAMAHPIRISILFCLKDGEKLNVTQIHERLNIEQSTASHHLGILKTNGVLCSKRDGKNSYYFLKHPLLGQVVDCLNKCGCEE